MFKLYNLLFSDPSYVLVKMKSNALPQTLQRIRRSLHPTCPKGVYNSGVSASQLRQFVSVHDMSYVRVKKAIKLLHFHIVTTLQVAK